MIDSLSRAEQPPARHSMLLWTAVAGVGVGVVATWSPLSLVVLALAALTVAAAGRGLPADERRAVAAVLVIALSARAAIIAALAVISIPIHNDQTAGILFGDEAYVWSRALRTRNVLLGFPASKYDYMVMFDNYANTRYMSWLSWMQLTFGPSPYMIRALNGVIFVGAASMLYRLARRGFGVTASLGGLVALLFVPSIFFWSISLLKESTYFLLSASSIAATLGIVRAGSWRARAAWSGLLAVALWAMSDLRPAAVTLTGGGLLLGVMLRFLAATRRRLVLSAAAAAVATIVALETPVISARVMSALTATAKQHTGHAFTLGHAYKTLDDKFYAKVDTPATSPLTLSGAEAARYVARSAFSFLTVPFPWEVATRSELAFIPEQLFWYVLVVSAAFGLVAAWRRDAFLTAILLGYMIPLSAALALTNGNVGTLVRLRDLVIPFLLWISALGCVSGLERLTDQVAWGSPPAALGFSRPDEASAS